MTTQTCGPRQAPLARTVHVERCMGTVFTFDVRDAGGWSDAIAAAVTELHRIDALFSTYRSDSEISRLRRGELHVDDAHRDVIDVLGLCAELHTETAGFFSARYAGGIDPTGVVKGWAIERVSAILRAHGSRNHAVNGGGDIQLAGEAAPGEPWRVGVVDPRDRSRVVTTVSVRDGAVATSGAAERGAHILDPFTGLPARGLLSATVVGPSLARADAYATAAYVMGPAARGWIARAAPAYATVLVLPDGTLAS